MPFTENEGVKIHYKIEGEGIPLVLLYGFMDTLDEWYELGYVESLLDNYMLIIIDLRGHGLSDKPHNSDLYSMKHLTSDIIAVLDDLEIEKTYFWGYSMGGHIGFGLTQYYPERFSAYILGGISPQPFDEEIIKKGDGLRDILKGGSERFLEYIESGGTEITDEVIEAISKFDFKALLAFWSADLIPEKEGYYRKVKAPIMMYVGEEDGWGHYPRNLEFVKEAKNVTLYSFPEVGHELHYNGDMVIPSVIEFLKNIK
ncbi:MAG: 3-oxoadipate enol-lactonase 2 [Candidatus Heimdallarchaeota archaeon AB_125]|nr:MAG: 3-oxoadipate enol-lactonase 2 [Candidatus Heimdallarchaeota archaeon AB_125]